jgi:DNA helicase TIP49 (TBP-interacting protein)
MHHFQAAIFEVDTGEIWYKVCKDSQQRHKQGKAEIVPHVLCMIKVEYMITFLNRALKNEITHLLLIDTNQGYTSHCVAS